MKRFTKTVVATVVTSCFALSANAALLFSDNFNHTNTANYDTTSPQDASQAGSLASAIEFRSSKRALAIDNNRLSMPWGGATSNHARGRFHDQNNLASRYDFAPALAALGSPGSMTVSFDYNIDAALGADRWMGFSFGTDDDTGSEPNTRINSASTDLGIIVKAAGDIQYFNNGLLVATLTEAHEETGTAVPVAIRISYDSLAEGGNITLESIKVGSTETLPAPVAGFNWESNGVVPVGAIHLELENRNANFIDNFAINAVGVPEPTTWTLGLMGIVATGWICRRRSVSLKQL